MKSALAHFLILLGRPIFIVLISVVRFLVFISRLRLPKLQLPPVTLPVFSVYLPRPKIKIKIRLIHPGSALLTIVILLSLSIFSFYYWILKDLPNPQRLTSIPPKQTTQIFDRNGVLLYRIFEDENRTLVSLSNLPTHLRQATIAIEDKNFYQHQGFSLSGIIRAIKRNVTTNQTQGGSTITQQLIKNTLLTREKSLIRKAKEILLAIHTELLFSKDDILQMYLNQVAYGGTAYGIQAASQQYFGKDAAQLDLAQSSLLAGLPQAPTYYSPFGQNNAQAKARQQTVLSRMVEDGYISQPQADAAFNQELNYASPSTAINAPHFVMYVRDLLVSQLGEDLVRHGGLQVYTTLDLSVQQIAQETLNRELDKIQAYHVTNGAVLVTNPSTGEILAMVGSKNYFDVSHDGQVNLTTALRQPGSAIKPINYALAFEKGYTPSATIDDSPVSFSTPGSPVWIPKNYDNRFHGTVSLRTALASSYNIPAIKLLAANGISQMVELAQKMGITTWNDPSRLGLSLTLGGAEVKMTDLAEAYGVFANGGRHLNLNPFLTVLDSHNRPLNLLETTSPEPAPTKQVISPQTAYLISDILSDNLARSPAFGSRSVLNLPGFQVAVKTGTSNDLRDNWTIGYTPDHLVAVWVGNNDNTPMNSIASGITGASPIWASTFSQLLNNRPPSYFAMPDNLIKVAICTLTNTLACPACPSIRTETFVKGTQPQKACSNDQIAKVLLEKQNGPTPTSAPNINTSRQILTGLSTSR